ncbi:MAG: NAD(P)/FAD-dependent oxidoreductase [Pseudomonadota bacterium]
MNSAVSRRLVLGGLATSALISPAAFAQTRARIVVVGGGFGGATGARTAKTLMPSAEVTLIEPSEAYTSCPFSNLVVSGVRRLEDQSFSLSSLGSAGVRHVRARAEDINAQAQTVTLDTGDTLAYDRLILSPGIDLRWGALSGYDLEAEDQMPHAWKAGPQTDLLRRQLEAMEDGGTMVMSVPAAPYRCPPGPYERASLIANYLKRQKPRSKLIVLDAKDDFSKKPLFLEAWAKHYPDHLEWRGAIDDGRVIRVDAGAMELETDFDRLNADVANIIPPQKAAEITDRAGVADQTGWCPIDAVTFESTLQPAIHVIGDAAIAAPMPKSAFSANLQAKVCAIQIARVLSGLAPEPTRLVNTCYSYTTPDQAISIVGAYSNEGGAFRSLAGAGGVSPSDADVSVREAEARQAVDWFAAITRESFG